MFWTNATVLYTPIEQKQYLYLEHLVKEQCTTRREPLWNTVFSSLQKRRGFRANTEPQKELLNYLDNSDIYTC